MSAATVTCDFTVSGTLIDNAQARHRSDAGLMLPVLCFSIQTESSTGTICHVQQLFPQGHEAQCEAAAKRLHKGKRVTVEAPSVGVELVAHNVNHVHVHKDEEQTPAAAPAEPAHA